MTLSPFLNPDDDTLRTLLRGVRVIAVVGLSPRPRHPSYQVARKLQEYGYRVVPVRPAVDEVLGERAYPALEQVPEKIDLVDVFRAPAHVDAITGSCVALKIPALWLQEGVVNVGAARRARSAGILVVMDRCLSKEYRRLFGG